MRNHLPRVPLRAISSVLQFPPLLDILVLLNVSQHRKHLSLTSVCPFGKFLMSDIVRVKNRLGRYFVMYKVQLKVLYSDPVGEPSIWTSCDSLAADHSSDSDTSLFSLLIASQSLLPVQVLTSSSSCLLNSMRFSLDYVLNGSSTARYSLYVL